ncbi:MAG: hypothetical protein HYZ23_02015 [Chloroflexi bacterium]|nr:hypothetical protein [Chloroflexota bacterium]
MDSAITSSVIYGIASGLIIILLGIVAYFLKTIHADLRSLGENFQDFTVEVVKNYATKTDLHEAKENCAHERRRIHVRIDEVDNRLRIHENKP